MNESVLWITLMFITGTLGVTLGSLVTLAFRRSV